MTPETGAVTPGSGAIKPESLAGTTTAAVSPPLEEKSC